MVVATGFNPAHERDRGWSPRSWSYRGWDQNETATKNMFSELPHKMKGLENSPIFRNETTMSTGKGGSK